MGDGAAKLNGTYGGIVSLGVGGALTCSSATAARFEAPGARLVVDGTPAFATYLPFSVEFWVKPDEVTTTPSFLVGRRVTTSGYMFTSSTAGVVFTRDQSGTVGERVTGPALTPGAWHHVVGVFSGTLMTVYVDGVPTSTAASLSNASGVAPFAVGTLPSTATGPTVTIGAFDEVAIYDKALLEVRVTAHYNAGKGL